MVSTWSRYVSENHLGPAWRFIGNLIGNAHSKGLRYRFDVRKFLVAVLLFTFIGSGMAFAHQPVVLLNTDTTAEKGPLLVDGTVSFAIRASFTKAGQKKAFRAQLKEGEMLSIQYLIVDKKPENTLRMSALPTFVITRPNGSTHTVKLNERTKFYEPFSKVNYFYLGRYNEIAQPGIYKFVIESKAKAGITIGVGDKEIFGEVIRGEVPSPTPTPSSAPAATKSTPEPSVSSTPKAETTAQSGYTMGNVRANNSETSCWSVIGGNVYNLTQWINSHPGGPARIRALCGTDGTSSFSAQHGSRGSPTSTLANYLLGPLIKG